MLAEVLVDPTIEAVELGAKESELVADPTMELLVGPEEGLTVRQLMAVLPTHHGAGGLVGP